MQPNQINHDLRIHSVLRLARQQTWARPRPRLPRGCSHSADSTQWCQSLAEGKLIFDCEPLAVLQLSLVSSIYFSISPSFSHFVFRQLSGTCHAGVGQSTESCQSIVRYSSILYLFCCSSLIFFLYLPCLGYWKILAFPTVQNMALFCTVWTKNTAD